MAKTILVHSFRHGVGRSNIVANLAFLLAAEGQQVSLIDTDTKLPAMHVLFKLQEKDLGYTFNDFLLGKCAIEQAAYDVRPHLNTALKGRLFLIPGNKGQETRRELNQAEDIHLLNSGCQRLIETLKLDTLLIDTQAGVDETALVTITIADTVVIILRLDQHDYQGTGVTMDLVRRLNVPRVVLIVNEAPATIDFDEIKLKLEQTYQCEVVAVLPYVDEVMALANRDIFALRYPDHPMTIKLKEVTTRLMT
jgi:MinD-like ATPase involved in chromosome partitioning or flagellar assembly